MKTKIIFLDVDGVLNTASSVSMHGFLALNSDCLVQLARIVEETGARIVLSSSWRLYLHPHLSTLRSTLQLYDLSIISTTKDFQGGPTRDTRAMEILHWLDLAEGMGYEVLDYVILDDDDVEILDSELEGMQVRTSLVDGLTYSAAQQAIQILGAPIE